MHKLIRLTARSTPVEMSFEELYEKYKHHIHWQSVKAKETFMYSENMNSVEDVQQELMLVMYDAYNRYDVERGAFTTMWNYELMRFKSHNTAHNTAKKRGGYVDKESGKKRTVKTSGIEYQTDGGIMEPVVDKSLEEQSFEEIKNIIMILQDFKTKNVVEAELIDDMINQGGETVKELADRLGVSRQYVNVVKNKLMLRLQKEIGDI